MENIIEIDSKRYKVTLVEPELTALPEKWYTDGTAEANEWAKSVFSFRHGVWDEEWNFVSNDKSSESNGWEEAPAGHTYITPTQFNEWVYKPWKESLKPKAPTTIEEVLEKVRPTWYIGVFGGIFNDARMLHSNQLPTETHAKSVLALCQLYNVAKCLNECFEGESNGFYLVDRSGSVHTEYHRIVTQTDVIRFTSHAAAQHAADHFWHLFQDYYMLEGER